MVNKQIPFHKPYITDDERVEVLDSLNSGWLTMGPKTVEFEKRFKEYVFHGSTIAPDAQYAISFNSATAALHLALKAIGIKRGDEVIIPTNTFVATAEVVTYFGAIPVLCDIEEDTFNINVSKIERLITVKTKAIIPVHFGGQPCDMDEIIAIAKANGLKVIEDAAHALPSKYKEKMIGTIGDITCFSFYATKTLATGEGGMAITSNQAFAENMKRNRLHGISRDAWDRYTMKGSWFYEVVDNGYKYNTTDINSALGLAQLRKIESMLEKRKQIAGKYNEEFKGTTINCPTVKTNRETSWHLYVVNVNNRNDLFEKLKDVGVGTSVHFIPVHKHPYYRDTYGYQDADFPIANRVFEHSLSLPIYPGMSEEDISYVIEMVKKYAK